VALLTMEVASLRTLIESLAVTVALTTEAKSDG
jgi:hypothetical protein